MRLVASSVGYLLLLAAYGHIGRRANAANALGRFSSLDGGDIGDYLALAPNATQRAGCELGLARLYDLLRAQGPIPAP